MRDWEEAEEDAQRTPGELLWGRCWFQVRNRWCLMFLCSFLEERATCSSLQSVNIFESLYLSALVLGIWQWTKTDKIPYIYETCSLFLDVGGLVAKSVSNFYNPMDCSLPGSSVHGFLQARILEWVAISFSRGSFWPRIQTQISCNAGRFFTNWATRESPTVGGERQ